MSSESFYVLFVQDQSTKIVSILDKARRQKIVVNGKFHFAMTALLLIMKAFTTLFYPFTRI